jgi:hypothetical protein
LGEIEGNQNKSFQWIIHNVKRISRWILEIEKMVDEAKKTDATFLASVQFYL